MGECKHEYKLRCGRSHCYKCGNDYIDILEKENADLRAQLEATGEENRDLLNKLLSYKKAKTSLDKENEELHYLNEILKDKKPKEEKEYDEMKVHNALLVSSFDEIQDTINKLGTEVINFPSGGWLIVLNINLILDRVRKLKGCE